MDHVALTFDDGPGEGTRQLLEALTTAGAPATMFVIGAHAERRPELVAECVEAGMWVENHSWSHPRLPALPPEGIEAELSRTQQLLGQVTGRTPRLFRPPYLATDPALQQVAAGLGLREVLADVDSRDWDGAGVEELVAAARRVPPGGVLMLHDWPAATAAAVPELVATLARRGLSPGRICPTTGRAVAP